MVTQSNAPKTHEPAEKAPSSDTTSDDKAEADDGPDVDQEADLKRNPVGPGR